MKEHIPTESGKRWAGCGLLPRACGEFKKLSNQFDALTPAKNSKPLATKDNIKNTTCGRVAVP